MVSLVLLQSGQSSFTQVALEAVQAGELVPGEIIVVDNGSTDESDVNWLRNGRVRLIEIGTNLGYHGGINVGWKAAQGDYIVLCNNDAILSKHCLSRLCRAMDANPDAGWLGAYISTGVWSNKHNFPNEVEDELTSSHGRNRESLNRWSESLGDRPMVEWTGIIDDCVVMVRRQASSKVGYFCRKLAYGHHTHDYGMRLTLAGYRTGGCPNAVAWHKAGSPTVNASGKWMRTLESAQVANATMIERWGSNWPGLAMKEGVKWEDLWEA